MQEFQSALHLVEHWLKEEQNHGCSGFDKVMELYVRHMLLPLGEIEKAEVILGECKNISNENKKV
jgi:hypothetical protein